MSAVSCGDGNIPASRPIGDIERPAPGAEGVVLGNIADRGGDGDGVPALGVVERAGVRDRAAFVGADCGQVGCNDRGRVECRRRIQQHKLSLVVVIRGDKVRPAIPIEVSDRQILGS